MFVTFFNELKSAGVPVSLREYLTLMEAMDRGFMYGWSFYDLDGHHWEVLWVKPAGSVM